MPFMIPSHSALRFHGGFLKLQVATCFKAAMFTSDQGPCSPEVATLFADQPAERHAKGAGQEQG